VWEWTTTPYRPSPGELTSINTWRLVPADAAWFVIKGGAFDTAASGLDLMAFYRDGFPSHLESPHQGFRCVMDPPGD
jgi:formylglycine-generating enzyme required for sulfatase activity